MAFLALGLLLPGAAQAAKSGGGVVQQGTMTFSPGAPFGSPCAASSITDFEASATGVVLEDTPAVYAGLLTLRRGDETAPAGSTICETFFSGGGSLDNLEITGDNQINGGKIDCLNVSGTYVRSHVRMQLRLFGDCTINLWRTEKVVFRLELQYQSDQLGERTTSAEVTGPFVVLPG